MNSSDKNILYMYLNYGRILSLEELIPLLIKIKPEELIKLIQTDFYSLITPFNIPQYSSILDGTINLIKYLNCSGDFGPSYVQVGKHFQDNVIKKQALTKYGENHSKLSFIMGLTDVKLNGSHRVYLSFLGKSICGLADDDILNICSKLTINIPIIRYLIKQDICETAEITKLMNNYLSESTTIRRRSNVITLKKIFFEGI